MSERTITLLDGGMGSELLARGGRTGLWSAQALLDAPALVDEVHRDYVAAGARVITTNTYSTIPSYLHKAGLADRFEELAIQAGEIARRVADQHEGVEVAGSLPPLDESYRPDRVPDEHTARPVYRALIHALEPFVDRWICETMSSAAEAECVASLACAEGGGKPVSVSWTLNEQPGAGLRSGETIAEAYARVASLDVEAFLFNCTSPEAILSGLEELRALTDKPIGAYPNRFVVPKGWTLDNEVQIEVQEISTTSFIQFAQAAIDCGASLIGGCCGIGPEHIRALSQGLEGK